MVNKDNRLIPIDEILNRVHAELMTKWRHDPFDEHKSGVVRWMQDLVYYSMITPVIYDEIVIVANEVLKEE